MSLIRWECHPQMTSAVHDSNLVRVSMRALETEKKLKKSMKKRTKEKNLGTTFIAK